ncbi:MAG: sigma-70 family RNA polymerase sigma factor [Bacteroidota bacterium]
MTNYKDLSDIELFIKIEKYDPYALEELYSRYSPLLYSLAARIVNDYQISEKILIDTFVSLWRKIDLFDFDSGNTFTWLVTLTRNKAVEHIRAKHTDGPLSDLSDDEYEDFFIIPDLDEKIESLDLVSAMKKRSSVENAVNSLTEAQKYVLYLSYYDGFTVNDIAEKLNIPLTTIRSKIMISLHSLRDNLLDDSILAGKNNDINEMIAAYAVGCMDNENHSYFKKHKKTGGYLPEKQLGELQTIISLLPIALNEISIADDLKDRLGYKLLEIHKKILDNSLPDRRIAKNIDETTEKKAQPPIPRVVEEQVNKNSFQELEHVKEDAPENLKSKLFWFFNFLLLAGLILFSYLLSDETSRLNEKVESMKKQLTKINSETSAAKDFITEHMGFIDFFNNPNIFVIPLVGGKENPKSYGRFFLSLDAGEGLLELKKMPKLSPNEYYSLWRIRKNATQNLASFKLVPENKYIKIAQITNGPRERVLQFILTVESKINAEKPSDQVYLSGKVLDP